MEQLALLKQLIKSDIQTQTDTEEIKIILVPTFACGNDATGALHLSKLEKIVVLW